MAILLCKKYGKVSEEYCVNCKERDMGARCTKFIMISSNAEIMGFIPRNDVRNSEGELTTGASFITEKGAEYIDKMINLRKRRKLIGIKRMG